MPRDLTPTQRVALAALRRFGSLTFQRQAYRLPNSRGFSPATIRTLEAQGLAVIRHPYAFQKEAKR